MNSAAVAAHQQGVGNLRRDFYTSTITFFISVLVSPSLPEPLLPTNRNALHPVVEKNRTRVALKRTGRRRRVAALGSCRQRTTQCAPLFM